MLIKLNIEGELLENLLKDAERNCRTNPKQIIYYLQEIYKGNIIVLGDNKQSTNRELTGYENTLVSTHKTNDSTNTNQSSTNIDQKGKKQLQEQVNNLDDDIANF